MISKNVSSAGKWQERPDLAWWIVGFVDGEGTFAINLFRNKTSELGWQCFPEFVITQGKGSIYSLLSVKEFFGCGQIYVNNRKDNHRENILRFCIRNRMDILNKVIPFFKVYKLKTKKREDFEKFYKIIYMLEKKLHLTNDGLSSIAKIVENMNRRKFQLIWNPQRPYAKIYQPLC